MGGTFVVLTLMLLQPTTGVDDGRSVCLVCHALESVGPVELRALPTAPLGSAEDAHRDLACAECHVNISPTGGGMAVDPESGVTDAREKAMLELRGRTGLYTLRGCRKCHEEIYDTWSDSIHGQSFGSKEGKRGEHALYPAFCTDCHGVHGMRAHDDPAAPTYLHGVPETCARCHQFSDVVSTYDSSVHGQKRSLTGLTSDVRVAVCTSCHGVHDIYAKTDPRSSVGPERKAATCGECHPGSTERFAASFSHRSLDDHWLLRLIRLAYIAIIGGTMAGMILFMIADLIRIALTHAKHAPKSEDLEKTYVRWGREARTQHLMLVVSFTLLAVTGVPLMFPQAPAAQAVMDAFGGPTLAALFHRAGAVLMIVASAVHGLWILGCIRKGARWSPMIPGPRDVRDMLFLVLYTFGLRRARPAIGRYGPIEKFEYWSLVWGTFVMVVTGLILWFPVRWAFVVGGIGIEAAQLIHALEALLAVLVILTWHMYHAHLVPESWPMSRVWLTGRISRWAMEELHPEELAELESGAPPKPARPPWRARPKPAPRGKPAGGGKSDA